MLTERRDPASVPADQLRLPAEPDLHFSGFPTEAFQVLERLREEPQIERYREEKESIQRFIKAPFRAYRDDVVVNLVMPNRLNVETERHVFSRFPKNDFGAGGAHHKYWWSWYRPRRRRLTDIQISHGLRPEHFHVGLFMGRRMKDLFYDARSRLLENPARFMEMLERLFEEEGWYVGVGRSTSDERFFDPDPAILESLDGAASLRIRRRLGREEVVAAGSGLVPYALASIRDLWPLYHFVLSASPNSDE